MKSFLVISMALLPMAGLAAECEDIHKMCLQQCMSDYSCRDECTISAIACHKAERMSSRADVLGGFDASKKAELEAFREQQTSESRSKRISERSGNMTDKSYADLSPGEAKCWLTWQACQARFLEPQQLNACEVKRVSCLSIEKWRAAVLKKRAESKSSLEESSSRTGSSSEKKPSVIFGGVQK